MSEDKTSGDKAQKPNLAKVLQDYKAQSKSNAFAYALLDAAPIGELQKKLRSQFPSLEIVSLYEDIPVRDVGDIEPLLVNLQNAPTAFYAWLEKEVLANSFATILWSVQDLKNTSNHLERLLDQEIPNEDGKKQEVVFRFFDPRISETLIPLLDENQKATLYGDAIENWGLWDRCGKWLIYPRAQTGIADKSGNMHFSQTQITKLDFASWPDQVITRIEAYSKAVLFEKTPCERYRLVVKHMRTALEKYQLRELQDIGLYTIFSLEFKEGWQALAPFAKPLKAGRDMAGRFSEEIEKIEDSEWDAFEDKHPELLQTN